MLYLQDKKHHASDLCLLLTLEVCLKGTKMSISLYCDMRVSSWDDSSSVSSGISDNIDTDDINTSSSISSYANTPAAQRKGLSTQVRLHTHGNVLG